MKSYLAALILTLSPSAIGAPVTLDPMDGEQAVEVEPSTHVTGSCGGAIIRVIGAVNANDETFGKDPDGTAVIVRKDAQHELRLASQLSDYNKLDCVIGKSGRQRFLVLATKCGGSLCPEAYSYTVIDPRTLRIKTPPGGVQLDALTHYL